MVKIPFSFGFFFLNKQIYATWPRPFLGRGRGLRLIIYLFLAVLGLRFCARAFSVCGERGPLFIVVGRPLTIVASLAAEHRLQTRKVSSCGSRAQ